MLRTDGAPWPPGYAATAARAMASTLAHRGPDDAGVWESSDGLIALSHRRLSIVDLSPLGRNPMSWDGGRLQITFNGEIYNFLELRRELENAGHCFRSQTDTEVILAAYDQWGIESVARLHGMFAFGLWDARRRRLWLVRDRLGKKPLYYAQYAGSLRFASELKGLVADGRFPREIDSDAVGLYLRHGYIPSPHTIYATARKLPPAHYAVWEEQRLRVVRYWDPLPHAFRTRDARSEDDANEELEAILETAIGLRRVADVPVGAFLSGGIDSSLVVGLMQEQSATPVRTFTIRFEKPEYNEADHAAAVARHLGTDHHEQTCSARVMLKVVDRLSDMFDEPFADSSAIPTYLLSNLARERVTVALSGDGGDELFFGYPRYRHHADSEWLLNLPRPIRRLVAEAASRGPQRRLRRAADVLRSDEADSYSRFVAGFGSEEIAALTGRPAAHGLLYADALARTAAIPREERPPLLDIVSYLPEDILTKVDRASMAVGLEVRAPLLDHRVVEFALGLPLTLKRRSGSTKWLLRQLLYKRVPRRLVERPKMGFGVPLVDWFKGPLRERMADFCSGHELSDLGIDGDAVRRLWQGFWAGRITRAYQLWQLYVLVAWARRFRQAPVSA